MAFRFFMVPVHQATECEAEVNSFLASHRILSVDRRFIDLGANSYWAICVDYQATHGATTSSGGKRSRVDYREVLSPEHFRLFVRLRELRADIAKQESAPVYTIFTNEQLAAMVERQVRNKTDLASIAGIGEARIAKYGDAFLKILQDDGSEGSREAKRKPV